MGKVANDTLLTETIAEARGIAGRWRFWLGLVGTGFVIGLTGPFGTYDSLPVVMRIGYWLAVVSMTFWLGYLVSFAIASWAEYRGMSLPLGVGLGAVAASVAVTALLAGFHTVFFAASFWPDAMRLFPYVMVIAVSVAALSETLWAREEVQVTVSAPPPEPAWLDQLPAHLGRDLILLQAEDHYVRARTELGETLIRAKLADAANDLGDFGIRLHRSWWVARSAVRTYRHRNGAPVVILRNGTELPVGRTYRRSVREALR